MIPIARPVLGETERERVGAVLESGMIADGSEVREFESEFADYCETECGVATSNGTAALQTALVALGIGDGDRVLTTPFSFVATANAIRHVGAEPVFADIDPLTYNLDPEAARDVAAEEDVDAILVVHLYGLPAELDEFVALAADLDIPLIEDCAQAHGATYRGDPVGSFGDAACFSFYPTKNMTTAEGGMVLTDREAVAERARRFVDHGRTDRYTHATVGDGSVVGQNFRLTNLAAAIGRAQLERLPGFVESRQENAARLTERLEGTSLRTPIELDDRTHAYHQYTVSAADRSRLQAHLENHEIGTGIYYPIPIHEQPAYADVRHDAPVAERASTAVLSVPVHPGLTDEAVEHIVEVIGTYAA